jgi:hypothetical protein
MKKAPGKTGAFFFPVGAPRLVSASGSAACRNLIDVRVIHGVSKPIGPEGMTALIYVLAGVKN